jgi:hypothetical protein
MEAEDRARMRELRGRRSALFSMPGRLDGDPAA